MCNSEWFSEVELLEPPGHIKLNLCVYGWIKYEVCKINIDTADELFARIYNAAACIKKCENQLRRSKRDIGTRVAKCSEVDGGILEYSYL
jgi:hypothetical protein